MVAVLTLLARRRYPFGAPAAFWLLGASLSFVDGELVPFMFGVYLAGMVAAFLLGNQRDPVLARVGLVVVLGCAAAVIYNIPAHKPGEMLFIPLLFGIAWLAGFALHTRTEQADAAEARAAHAERERESAARLAVAEERTRIARELHDIVAHAVSVMVLQVGAVRHKLPDGLADDADALRGVEQTGRAALAEMRRLLGAMRSDGDGLELAPQPGLDGLESLAREVERAGLPVRLHVEGEPVRLPRAIDLSAYRIVQEGLTNALKHARASHADVTLRYEPEEVRIEVRDDGKGDSRSNPGLRPRRHPRTRQDLRRRDDGGNGKRRRLRPEHAPSPREQRPMSIRVLVADDQSMVRAGFRMLLGGEEDIEVVAEASNGLEAVEKAARFQPTVVLMDIRMPELDGLEATRRILAADGTARILILTTFDLDEYVYEALRAGASGFVLKDEPPEQLIAAIRTVAAGEALLSPTVTKRVIERFTRLPRPTPPRGFDELTAREQDVFRLIANGLSNTEIAQELFISDTTVKTHITHIFQKLDIRDRVQAVVLAYQSGLFAADAPQPAGGDERATD